MIFRPLGSYRRLSSCLLSASLLALWGCDSEGSSSGRAEALDSCNLELNEGYETWQAETQNGAKSYVFVVQATSESWGEDEDGETVREIRVSRFRNVVKDGRVIASSQNGASKVPTRKGAPSDAYTIEAFFEQLADLPCGDELDEFEEVLVSVDPERGYPALYRRWSAGDHGGSSWELEVSCVSIGETGDEACLLPDEP